MAYKFKPYRSVYRDPQTVKINEILRKRYVDAFAADTMTQTALSDMLVSADFAGDVEKAAQLRATIDARSNKYAESGRYEMLGTNVARDAGEFLKGYNPLKKNYEAREAAKTKAQATLNPDDYEKWLGWSLTRRDEEGNYQPYSGIEYDDSGYVIPDSYYTADPVPPKVDINAEILKQVNALPIMKQGGYTAASFSMQEMVDEQGNVTKIPVIRTTQGQIISGKDNEAIGQAVQAALGSPEIQSYLNFKSEINTWDTDAGSLQGNIEGRVQELQLELARATGDKRDNIQAQIADLKRAQQSGMPAQMRDAAANIYKQRMIDKYQSDAERFAGQSVYGGANTFQINPLWLKSLENDAQSPDVANRPVFAGAEQSNILAAIAQQEGVNPEDVVVTAESLRAGEEALHAEAVTRLEATNAAYPEFANVLEANNVDPSNLEEIENYIEDLNYEDIQMLAQDIAAGGQRDANEVLKDMFQLQAAMMNHADRASQVDAMIDYANTSPDVSNTPLAIHNAALTQSGNITEDAMQYVIRPEGDTRSEAVSAAEAVAHHMIKDLFTAEGKWSDRPNAMTISPGNAQNIFDMLTPLLTNPENGFGLEDGEAREVFNTALAYAQAQYDAASEKGQMTATNLNPQGEGYRADHSIAILPGSGPGASFSFENYLTNVDNETTRRAALADEAINDASRITFSWPDYRTALGDYDGVESDKLRDAAKEGTLASFATAVDLTDRTAQSVGAENAAWRTAVDDKGDEKTASQPLEDWKVTDLTYGYWSVNGEVIPTVNLAVSAGTGNNKVDRIIRMDANQAVRNYMNFEPGLGETGSFGDAILGYTPADQFQVQVLNALSTAGGVPEVDISLPGSSTTGRVHVSIPIERNDKGSITGYPSVVLKAEKAGQSTEMTIDLAYARSRGYEDVLQAAAAMYLSLVSS